MTENNQILIKAVSPKVEEVRQLIAELDAYQSELYPAESNHLAGIDELAQPNALFVVAYVGDQAVGCGAVKIVNGDYGEIKRVYVLPQARGLGLAKKIMAWLEAWVLNGGSTSTTRLETGIHQKEAIGLYKRLGYEKIDPFGDYQPDPLSIFMEKQLGGLET